jgi:glycine dehydrogenase subunit 2
MRKTTEPLIFELSKPGRMGVTLPKLDVPPSELPADLLRDDLPLPEVSELGAVRHYTHLSQMNTAVDTGFYPLGSCTMKYNPKVNEAAARLPGFARTHPYQPPETVQGNLQVMYELQEALKEIGGFAGVSLQPAAGAHGEFTGILMMRAYHQAQGQAQRNKVLIPDSAHGTNPASSAMSGYLAVEIPSDRRGNVDLAALRRQCGEDVVGLMLTNPNTLGLFEEHVLEVAELIHRCGGLMYGDGANLNALLGMVRPGDLGFDVLHFNLHKTFSTPHGGGGPGAGPVGASQKLAAYLPGPMAIRAEDSYRLAVPDRSIGRVKAFYGNFSVCIRAYTYIRMLGEGGLQEVAQASVLNANYLRTRLQQVYRLPYDRVCMHEFVLSGRLEGAPEVHTLDIAKRLIDFGFHPPTVYFPLIVPEALMIEPTDTESPETLDSFAEALLAIAQEARSDPHLLHEAPHQAPVTRLDEVRAARHPDLNWKPEPPGNGGE